MSPRDFAPDVLIVRLQMIDELLSDLGQVGEIDADRLRSDRMLRHAIERVLSQLVDLAVGINTHVAATRLGKAAADYRASFDLAAELGVIDEALAIRLRPSVGLRNVLAHEYVQVDLRLVALATRSARIDYADYRSSVAAWLRSI